jgi:hypothetical protein
MNFLEKEACGTGEGPSKITQVQWPVRTEPSDDSSGVKEMHKVSGIVRRASIVEHLSVRGNLKKQFGPGGTTLATCDSTATSTCGISPRPNPDPRGQITKAKS